MELHRLFVYCFHLFLLFRLAFATLRRHSEFDVNVEYTPAIAAPPPDALPYPPQCIDELSPPLEKFIEPLTFPPVIDVSNGQPLTLGAYRISQKLHRDLPNTTLYAFGTSHETATFPGPTLMARRYVAAHVRWENHIPDEHHFLPQPNETLVEWARPSRGSVPVVAHLHGAEVPSIYDGNPDAWFTSKNETGPAYTTQDYIYPNRQNPTTLWYHDHTLGITRLNNLAGLTGLYILRPTEEDEKMLNLPNGIPLIIKDWRFFANGSLNLPGPASFDTQYWCPEWFDTWLVNGKVWPFLRVYAKPYRLRILQASNARYVGLYFSHDLHNLTCLQIGTDGGFLAEPMSIDNFLLFPADRIDVVVDFSELQSGVEVILRNFPMPLDGNDEPFLMPENSVIMKFIVVEDGGTEEGIIMDPHYMERLPRNMRRMAKANENKVHMMIQSPQVRTIDISARSNLLTHRDYAFSFGNETWHDPITIDVVDGSTEIWEVINYSQVPHSMHIHLIQFQVINQQSIDIESYLNHNCSTRIEYPNDGTCFLDYPQSPRPYQQGWKDNVITWDNFMLRILLHFTTREGHSFNFDPTQGPGYLFHCHILQHEDHMMMRPYRLRHEEDNSH